MNRILLALVLVLATPVAASAQVTGPLPNPPPLGSNQTATLLFNTQMEISRQANSNPQGAQQAAVNYQQAISAYQRGDIQTSQAAALQAMMNLNHPSVAAPTPVVTPLPPTNYGAIPNRLLATGDVASIDANAFIGEARGAVAACVAQQDPAAGGAQAQLANAIRANQTGKYSAASGFARNAVNLCAAAQQRSNAKP